MVAGTVGLRLEPTAGALQEEWPPTQLLGKWHWATLWGIDPSKVGVCTRLPQKCSGETVQGLGRWGGLGDRHAEGRAGS